MEKSKNLLSFSAALYLYLSRYALVKLSIAISIDCKLSAAWWAWAQHGATACTAHAELSMRTL